MTSLVVAEHDNAGIKPSTLNTITAASQCGGDVHVLVAGHNAAAAAAAAAAITGVAKVIHADSPAFANGLAENVTAQVVSMAGAYSHILFPATAVGKANGRSIRASSSFWPGKRQRIRAQAITRPNTPLMMLAKKARPKLTL